MGILTRLTKLASSIFAASPYSETELETWMTESESIYTELYSLVEGGVAAYLASVDLATTGNVTLSGEQTIDGTLTSTSRVLVKSNTDASENGVYTTGSGAWTRTTDADTATELANAAVFVTGGTANGGTTYKCNIASTDTLDTDDCPWVLISDGTINPAIQAALDLKADDSAVVHDTGNETIAGTKTFSSAPSVPDASFSIAKTSGLQTLLDNTVNKTGTQTVAGAKTFSDAATFSNTVSVPDGSFTIAKTTGLQTALDAAYSKTEVLFIVPQRNGESAEAIGTTLSALSGVIFRGCEKGRLYRIARYQNGSTTGGVAQGIKITSIDERRLYDATTEREEIATTLEPVSDITAADGNQRFLRYLSSDENFEAIVVWNTDDLPSNGTVFDSTANDDDGWSHFINPTRYHYRDAVPVGLKTLKERLYNPLTSVRIRFEGDSITFGVGAPGNTVTYAEDSFVATEGQTVFTLSSSLEGAEDFDVYLDDVVMDQADYSRVGDTLTLVSGVSAGTVVDVRENSVFHSLLTRPAPHTSGSYVNRIRLALLQTVFGRVSSYQTSSASETGTGRMYRGTYEYRAYKKINPTDDPALTFYDASDNVITPATVTSGIYEFGEAATVIGGQSFEFDMVGNIFKFSATNLANDADQTLDVYVDGSFQESLAVPDSATTGQDYVVTIGTGYGEHTIKIVNNHTIATAALANIYLETVEVSKLVQVINNGVSGTTAREWAPGGNSTYGTYVSVDTTSAPSGDFHIVALGTNDRVVGTRFSFMDNLAAIIDYHQAAGRYVIVLAHTFMDDSKDYPNSPYIWSMADFVEDMRRICARKNCDFVDIFSLMAIEEMNGSASTATDITAEIADGDLMSTSDYLHPNGDGHAFIAKEFLKRVFAGA